MSTVNGAYLPLPSFPQGTTVPSPAAGWRLTFVAYRYRASDGTHGVAASPALVPAGAVIERTQAGI
jgi:hypothetical protein